MIGLLEVSNPNIKPYQRRFVNIGQTITVIGGLAHVAFIGLFLLIEVPELAYFNILSCIIFTSSFILIRNGHIYSGFILNILEIVSHQFLCVYFLGQEFGFQYYLMSVVTFVFFLPDEDIRFRYKLITGILSVLLAAGLIVYGNLNQPVYNLRNEAWTPAVGFLNTLLALLIGNIALVMYVRAAYSSEKALELEINKSDELLHNILPTPIASRLKESSATIADGFGNASVLFADVVGFTELSQRVNPGSLVKLLNTVFSEFDDLVDRYGLEKIKTIGDAYMVASGIPNKRDDHASALAEFALEMQRTIKQFLTDEKKPMQIRIGINSGPVVAGVIGKRKFIYDLWGDTVNTAARMESHGIANEIQITESTYRLLKDDFLCEERGSISIKGKGDMRVYILRQKK